ncbi:hypothetical protein N9Y19_04465 [Porticoccaceae bacterium]|nr:hypothetical protein [Porticoccaceae bacterium]
MTKTKKAFKEVNKMADREILKAQYSANKIKIEKWLNVKVYGFKRGTILISALVIIAAIFTAS